MDTKNLQTTSNTEMLTISRAEYEEQQKRMAALEHCVSELEQQNQWLLEQLGDYFTRSVPPVHRWIPPIHTSVPLVKKAPIHTMIPVIQAMIPPSATMRLN